MVWSEYTAYRFEPFVVIVMADWRIDFTSTNAREGGAGIGSCDWMITGVGVHSQVSSSALTLLLLYQSVAGSAERNKGGHVRDESIRPEGRDVPANTVQLETL